jgi:hypothetical protein
MKASRHSIEFPQVGVDDLALLQKERFQDWHKRRREVGALGAHRRARWFKPLQCERDVTQGGAARLKQQRLHVNEASHCRKVDDRPTAVPSPNGDEALTLKNPQRFSDRWEAHAELGLQLLLARESGILGNFSLKNLLAQI